MSKKGVKVTLEMGLDGGMYLKSLSKMFMMEFDDIVNLVLWLEIKKRKELGQEEH